MKCWLQRNPTTTGLGVELVSYVCQMEAIES